MVEQTGIQTESFEGFSVLVPGDRTMQCTMYVPSVTVTMGNYSMTDRFFVVDVSDTNIVMGVQWFYCLGRVTKYRRKLEMEFMGPDGRMVLLRGMHSYTPQIMSTHRMEADSRHGEIEGEVKLKITKVGTQPRPVHLDIHEILDRYPTIFGDTPTGRPPDQGFEHTIELNEGVHPVIITLYL